MMREDPRARWQGKLHIGFLLVHAAQHPSEQLKPEQCVWGAMLAQGIIGQVILNTASIT